MTKFEIGDRVKCVRSDGFGVYVGEAGKIYTIVSIGKGTISFAPDYRDHRAFTGVSPGRFELYAKAGEFVVGDKVIATNTYAEGEPRTVTVVEAHAVGQRICFSGGYWSRADAYRLATSPSEQGVSTGAEIAAADFDFSTIKAGDELVLHYKVHCDGLDIDGYITAIQPGFGTYYYKPSAIHSVIPAPKPKTLRERAIEAATGITGFRCLSTESLAIVDAVLAEVEKGQ